MNSTVPLFLLPLGNITVNRSLSCGVYPQHVSIIVFLLLVFPAGFFLNIFSVWVFCCRVPHWSSCTVLQFHLAVSDAIVTPVAPLMAAYFLMGSHWVFGSFMCKLKIALLVVHFYGSILFLTLISIHRYVSVVQFKKVSLLKRKAFVHKLCAGVWLVLLTVGFMCFCFLNTSQVGTFTQCLSIHQEGYIETYFVMNFILLVPGFLLPFSVSVACYILLAKSMSRININTSKGRSIKLKSFKMVATCLVIFGVCFVPLNIIRTIVVVLKKFFPGQCDLLLRMETAYYVSWILAGANCCLDPLIYCFGSHKFVMAIHKSLRKHVIYNEDPVRNEQMSDDNATYSPSVVLTQEQHVHIQHSSTS
ncbi:P2Y purinoceptor 2 [Esox lucius]|uniref:P2Y purinoceptor 2 n=1 Tax=Esox lucius TaxID=8010 RepID=UPI0009731ED7|nr:P2Y purinoceptor 2 [Esox lucius]